MPKVVMTLMVRDEADIISPMIEHHLAQGVTLFIVTDNASTDGTREILQAYADKGVLELHDDPRHEKQQAEVVTAMARRAASVHGADWVINADADEFFLPVQSQTLAEALSNMPSNVQSFDARVRNLMGMPLASGAAILSHVWRDERSDDQLAQVGLHAHPTQDCIHRASAEVNVVQGNHATDLPLTTRVPEPSQIEVLHLPYRTWDRYRHRVEITAEAYAKSNRTPSPRHHGMRDARWLKYGVLKHVYVARHPEGDEPAGFIHDRRIVDSIERITSSGQAVCPEQLSASLTPAEPITNADTLRKEFEMFREAILATAELRASLEYRTQEFYATLQRAENAEQEIKTCQEHATDLNEQLQKERSRSAELLSEAESLRAMVSELTNSRAVRTAAAMFVKSYDRDTYGRGLAGAPGRIFTAARNALHRSTHRTSSSPEPPGSARNVGRDDAASAETTATQMTDEEIAATLAREAERAESFKVYNELWRTPPNPSVLFGRPNTAATPLIMCLWNRPRQIGEILNRLDDQQALDGCQEPKLRVMFWNNCQEDREWYESQLREYSPSGAIDSIEIVHSPRNIRGIGRFIAARYLHQHGCSGAFLMFDDDQLIGEEAVSTLLAAAAPRTLAGLWSWHVSAEDYWDRTRAADGETVDYVATGGCACDFELINDDSFFEELPELGLYIEDVWMSRFAAKRGWTLRAVSVPVEFVLPETNQYNELLWDKIAFWKLLGED